MRRDIRNEVLLPLIVLLGLTLLFWLTRVDIYILKPFYNNKEEWFLGNGLLWILLHKYGSLPGILLGVASLITLVLSLFVRKFFLYRKAALFLILFLGLA